MADPQYIEEPNLPAAVRVGKFGFALSAAGLTLGGGIVKVLEAFIPGIRGGGIPPWLWPILIIIWAPGLLGFVLSFYTVARYPYLNLATGGGPRIALSSRWIWVPLGWIFYLLAPLVAAAAFAALEDGMLAVMAMLFLAMDFAFAGFLLTSYRREKHPTIATFLELTFGAGIVLFPIYLPSLIIGSVRCRRFLRSLNDESVKGTEAATWA